VAASARNNLKIRISLRRVSILRGEDQCCYFISLSPEQRKKQLISIVRSFHSLWGKYAREKQDIKMLNEMNNTSWVWPDNINW
ncbi:hypothetical protein NL391_26360, partial [Klebsiella pneumoniae]|nr:hypothetical protein [Klebsiella pneumoniae]